MRRELWVRIRRLDILRPQKKNMVLSKPSAKMCVAVLWHDQNLFATKLNQTKEKKRREAKKKTTKKIYLFNWRIFGTPHSFHHQTPLPPPFAVCVPLVTVFPCMSFRTNGNGFHNILHKQYNHFRHIPIHLHFVRGFSRIKIAFIIIAQHHYFCWCCAFCFRGNFLSIPYQQRMCFCMRNTAHHTNPQNFYWNQPNTHSPLRLWTIDCCCFFFLLFFLLRWSNTHSQALHTVFGH